MTSRHKSPKERNPSTDGAVLGFVALATTMCDLTGAAAARWCNLLERISWAVIELSWLVLKLGHGLIGSPSVCEGSRVLQLLLHVGPCIWCVLHFLAGRA